MPLLPSTRRDIAPFSDEINFYAVADDDDDDDDEDDDDATYVLVKEKSFT